MNPSPIVQPLNKVFVGEVDMIDGPVVNDGFKKYTKWYLWIKINVDFVSSQDSLYITLRNLSSSQIIYKCAYRLVCIANMEIAKITFMLVLFILYWKMISLSILLDWENKRNLMQKKNSLNNSIHKLME